MRDEESIVTKRQEKEDQVGFFPPAFASYIEIYGISRFSYWASIKVQ